MCFSMPQILSDFAQRSNSLSSTQISHDIVNMDMVWAFFMVPLKGILQGE